MRRTIAVAVAAAMAWLVLLAPASRAQGSDDKTALSAWLASCDSARDHCLASLRAGYGAAYEDMAEICPPDGMTQDAAAETELRWLKNAAAANKAMAAGPELDAEWTALHTLWPCSD